MAEKAGIAGGWARVASPLACAALLASCAAYNDHRPLRLSLTGSERDERSWRCEGLGDPASYCASYAATARLRGDPNALRAGKFCRRFYRSVLEGAHLLCAYVKEMDALHDEGDGQDSYLLSARGKFVHRRYSERAADLVEELDRAYEDHAVGGIRRANADLDLAGRENLARELGCEGEGSAEEAPGLYLLGLVEQAERDQERSYRAIRAGLRRLQARLQISGLAPERAPASEAGSDALLRSSSPRTISARVQDLVRGARLDGPALLRLGRLRAPGHPGLDAQFERMLAQESPELRPSSGRPKRDGRSLASVPAPGCPPQHGDR